ncbi:substance-P receptor-like isoform X2 [Ostrea edulis]|uniref:substance-P receptor-like isoform X2 n=1 Tax=Ostrea edulis TaxID=37623 RepID=UPI0020961BD7|nr:substance-P receptor-like isoform X2 [Ostrea edulis]
MENDTDLPDFSFIPYGGVIKEVPLWEIIVKSLIYGIITIFSLIGNILIIVIVMKNKNMKTVTNYYIVNLAVADLMVTLTCTWVTLVDDLTEGWILGAFFFISLVASVLSLTQIAYDRFFGIVFALRARMTERRASISLVIIWIFSIIVALPLLFFRQMKSREWLDHTELWCDDAWPYELEVVGNITRSTMPLRTAYFVSVSVVLYFIPAVVMSIAYGVIILKLKTTHIPGEIMDKRDEQQAKTKRKIIIMLITILVVFCVCWLPCQVMLLYTELRDTRSQLDDWYYKFEFAAYTMAYSNSALNPLIYAGFNENFKQGLLSIWRRISGDPGRRLTHVYGTYTETTYTAV